MIENTENIKIGFLIICRYNSNRLPGKILKEINGKPVLKYIHERLLKITNNENIVVATSTTETDEPIVEYCQKKQINVYRGSLNNVAERFMNCAKEYGFNFVVRINGDNLFLDINTLHLMLKITRKNEYDFISNVKKRSFPKGMSIEIVRLSFYENLYNQFTLPEHFEHVTLFLYENDKNRRYYYFYNYDYPKAKGVQLAIDTEEDFRLAENIINSFEEDHTQYGLKEICEIREKFIE